MYANSIIPYSFFKYWMFKFFSHFFTIMNNSVDVFFITRLKCFFSSISRYYVQFFQFKKVQVNLSIIILIYFFKWWGNRKKTESKRERERASIWWSTSQMPEGVKRLGLDRSWKLETQCRSLTWAAETGSVLAGS